MANNEERIKAFFNDEEKVKALASDEEFMKKVLSGEVTPEAYKKEFEKFGLNLTLEEAEEILKSADKVVGIPAEALDEISLGGVSGGGPANDLAVTLEGVSTLGAVGFGIAGLVYQYKTVRAYGDGDMRQARRYLERSAKLFSAATGLGALAAVSDQFRREMGGGRNNLNDNDNRKYQSSKQSEISIG